MIRDERGGTTGPIGTPAVYSKMKMSGRRWPRGATRAAGTNPSASARRMAPGTRASMCALRSSSAMTAGAPRAVSVAAACGPVPPRA